MFALLGIWYR